ncbi:autotransporter assembly complex protein TamB [Vibrio gallicus]|uniref:autotransporter assembly complex protein TamB n=1 Tax=Vibrio gallicus TaxID=190897 RepID=UPI0021C2F6E4|nr:translocation/assembly module TamB domain-containing protein [Vibrio gallicus]
MTQTPPKQPQKKQHKKRPLWKRILWTLTHLSLGVLALILFILALLYFLLFTNSGLKSIVWTAEQFVSELSVDEVDGALLTDFRLYNIDYKNPQLFVDFHADKLELDLQLRCLPQAQLCVDTLGVEGAKLALTKLPPSEDTTEDEASEPLRSVSIPFGIGVKINDLYLNKVDLSILGNKVTWREFKTGAQMRFDNLTLTPTSFDGGRVTLAPTPESTSVETKPAPSTAETEAPIVLPEVWIPLSIDIQGITVTDFKLTNPDVQLDKVNLVGFAKGNNVDIQNFDLSMPQLDANLKGNSQLVGDYPLQLKANAKVKQTQAAGQSLSLDAEGSIADLALNASLRDLIHADIKAKLKPLDPKLPFDIALSKAKLQWPLKGKAEYKVQIASLMAKGNLKAYSLQLDAAAQGTQIPDVDLNVDGHGSMVQLDLRDIDVKTLGGEVKGKVLANWDNLVFWKADLNLEQIQPGTYWPQAEGNISGQLQTSGRLTQAGGWEVKVPKLDIDGIFRQYPLNINGALEAKDPQGSGEYQLKTPGLVVAHGQNRIRLSGGLDKQWDLDAKIDVPKLGHTVPDVNGAIIGSLKLRGAQNTPEVITDIVAKKIKWLEQLTVDSVSVKGDVIPLPTPKGRISLGVNQLDYQGQKVTSSEFNFNGSQQQHRFDFSIDSEMVKGALSVEGGAKETPGLVWDGRLNSAQFTTLQGTWRLDHAPNLAYDVDKQQAFVEAHCWLQSQSKICLDKDVIAGQSGEVFASISQFDFSQIQPLLPPETLLKGKLNATARAKWSPTALPELELQVEMPTGSVTQKLDRPLVVAWNDIALSASLMKDNLSAKWLIDLKDNGDLKGEASIANVSKQNKQLDARIQLQKLTLQMLQPLFGEFSEVGAEINSDLHITGPALQPKIVGDFKVKDLVAKGDATPVDIQSGDLTMRFSGYQAQLQSNIETQEGKLNLKGDADWTSLEDWHAHLNLAAQELLVELPPEVKAKVSPNISVAITPGLIDVSGEVRLPWARIEVKELPPSAISVSSDEIVVDKDLKPIEQTKEFPFKIHSNIKVIIGNDFRLSAFGLKGSLVGELNVSQKNNAPFILGEVSIVDGSYRSFGQDLLIDEGKVQFNGPADQPFLSIKAIRNPENTEDDVIAGIRVTGPADEPSVQVFSEPSMPQANALSYILRGRDLDSSSGGNTMTTALIGLSLAQSGRLVGEIGEAFGVSDLQLDTAGSGDDSQVTVSGYILPGLQVKYGVGIFEPIGEFTFRYRIMKELYLEVMSGADNAVDLLYQFEFN